MSSPRNVSQITANHSRVTSLQQLEGRFNFLVGQASAIVTIIADNGKILYQSPSLKRILGYDSGKRIGKNFLHSKLVHPDDLHIKEELYKKALLSPNTNFKNELRMRHKNGTWSWMEVLFNNQLANKSIAGIVVITHDITQRKRLEIQKNEFLSIASHELKTPLTTIRAYGQLLIKRLSKDQKKEQELKFLENILSQTDKLTGLIDDLLDMSKLQEGKFSVQHKPFQMQALIKNLIEDFGYISVHHTIELKQRTKAFVLGDETRIAQVVMNLLTNAIKHSPEFSLIQIHIERKGKYIVTSVTDRGEGIPVNKQKFVFDRFFKIDDGKARPGGTGLGLYIAAEIIKLHNGKIWLQSKKGKGSTFFFSLPVGPKS